MGYASLTDLANVVPATAIASLSTAQQQAALDAASAEFDTCGRARYAYPIQLPYDAVLVRDVCKVAAYELICLRGYNPQSGSDKNFADRADQARKKWYEIKTQASHYNIVENPAASATQPTLPAPLVVSQGLQGWNPGATGSGVY